MLNIFEVAETNKMIEQENLDVRTITLGISLLDCIDGDIDKLCDNIYNKITTVAKDLVKTGNDISLELGIPIVNTFVGVKPCDVLKHDATAFTIVAGGFDVIGNATHKSTSWIIEDIYGNVVWCSLEDELNKESIFVEKRTRAENKRQVFLTIVSLLKKYFLL